MLDAVIVGGGPAGLAAAYALRERRTVLLEKEAYLGGRVLTRRFGDIACDMGAVLAYDPRALPFGLRPPAPLVERGRLGLHYRGRTSYGKTVLEAISGALGNEEAEAARSFAEGRLELGDLPPRSRDAVNAFFRTIHPGEIEEYAPERHRDAFVPHVPAHYPGGNVGVVHALRQRSTTETRTGVAAQAIVRGPAGVAVACLQDDRALSFEARAAVVAVPAPAARRLLGALPAETEAYLDAVRYGQFTVAAIGVRGAPFVDFSYIVSPELAPSTICKQEFPDSPIKVLIGYFGDRASQPVAKLEDADIVERLRGAVCEAGVGDVRSQDVVFSDVVRWPLGGTIVSRELRERWSPGLVAPEESIFLAGDYLRKDFPYGIDQAIRSGVEAGQRVQELLEA